MIVFVFGSEHDTHAWLMADKIKEYFPEIEFIKSENPDDIIGIKGSFIIMDVAEGLIKPKLLEIEDIRARSICTLHDFDLGMTLKLAGQMSNARFRIIGIPKNCAVSSARRILEKALKGMRLARLRQPTK